MACASYTLAVVRVGIAQGLPQPIGPAPGVGQGLPQPILPPNTVQPAPEQYPVAPIIDPGLPLAPSQSKVSPLARDAHSQSNIVAEVNPSAIRVPAIIEQLLKGKMTPQKAWDSGALNIADLLYVFTDYIDDWGAFKGQENPELLLALARLLTEHTGEKLKNPAALPIKLRLWLGVFFQTVRDERTVSFLESVLQEFKAPMQGNNPTLFLAIERLAWYYRDKEKPEQAADTWVRLLQLKGIPDWWLTDGLFFAGTLYQEVGNEQKAADLYATIAKLRGGDEIFKAEALQAYAKLLIKQNHLAAVRQLLQQAATTSATTPSQVVALSMLGYSYYVTGNWKDARHYSQQAIAKCDELPTLKLRIAMHEVANDAKKLLALADQWDERSIQSDPAEVEMVVVRDKRSEATKRTLFVTTHEDVILVVKSNDPRIKAHIEPSPWATSQGNLMFEREIILDIAAAALAENSQITISISNPKDPLAETNVPVYVKVED